MDQSPSQESVAEATVLSQSPYYKEVNRQIDCIMVIADRIQRQFPDHFDIVFEYTMRVIFNLE